MNANKNLNAFSLSLAFICVHLRTKLSFLFFFCICFSTFTLAEKPSSVEPELRQLLTKAINDSTSFDDRFHAEVWLLDMSNRLEKYIKNKKQRLSLLKRIHQEANRVQLAPELVLALIEVESHFDSYAISKSGAQGLMQVMPFWLNEIGHPDDNLININTNLRMGCTILKYYMDIDKHDLHKALARYNGSKGSRVYSNKVIYALQQHWYKA